MFYNTVKIILKIFFKIYNRISILNADRIPLEGSLILVANHVSYLDPLYIGVIFPRKLFFMAKKESFNTKLSAWLLGKLGAYPIDRGKADISAVKTTIKILKSGKVLAMFPQGERRGENSMSEIKQGAAYFAVKTNTPIIPVYIQGTEKVMPKGQKLIKPQKVRIYVGQEIYPVNNRLSAGEQIDLLTKTVKEAINELAEKASSTGEK